MNIVCRLSCRVLRVEQGRRVQAAVIWGLLKWSMNQTYEAADLRQQITGLSDARRSGLLRQRTLLIS